MDNFDHLFYLKIYPDLPKKGIKNRIEAYKHYINHGKSEGRICNSDMLKNNCEDFDHIFYLEMYPDLLKNGINNEHAAYIHYIHHGKVEGRICNSSFLNTNMKNNISVIEKQNKGFKKNKTREELINILIRTSNRPEYFDTCINSILYQNYTNYNIIICFDKIESLQYLEKYKNNDKITYFPIFIESDEKYKFNLYCNMLMDKVNDGYIMFLDDDDKLTHNNVLNILNEELNDENCIYIWNFLRPDKIIYPNDINNIKLGDIDTTSVCFHNNHKNKSIWIDQQFGDYHFFGKLFNIGLQKIFIDYILTSTIHVKKIGLFGN